MRKLLLLNLMTIIAIGAFAFADFAFSDDNIDFAVTAVDENIAENTHVVVPQLFERHGQRILAHNVVTADESDKPTTVFRRPKGTFYCGISTENQRMYSYIYAPAFCDLTFENFTTGTDQFSWTYKNPQDTSITLTSTEKDLTIQYRNYYNTIHAPVLTASNTVGDSVFVNSTYLRVGGVRISHSQYGIFGATNYNPRYSTGFNYSPAYSGTKNATVNSYYTQAYKQFDVDTVKVVGCAELNDKPLSPYLLNGVYAHLFIAKSGNITAKVYEAVLDDDGEYKMGDLLSSSTVAATAKNGISVLKFNVTDSEGENLQINDAIFTILEAADNNVIFYPLYTKQPRPIPDDVHAYNLLSFDYDGVSVKDVVSANFDFSDGTHCTSWAFGYSIAQYFLHCDADTIPAPNEGLDSVLTINSSLASSNWNIEMLEAEDVPDWITIGEPNDSTYLNSSEQTVYAYSTKLPITIASLPEDTRYREADITISYLGAQLSLHVQQGRPPIVGIPGDVNNDYTINVGDVSTVYDVILGVNTEEDTIERANVNEDDTVNVSDVSSVYELILIGNEDTGEQD